jgi:hypothetical protein
MWKFSTAMGALPPELSPNGPEPMGSIYGRTDDYSLGYVLLAIVALSVAVFTATVVRRGAR